MLNLSSNVVTGDAKSIRDFFMAVCDALETNETYVEELESQLSELDMEKCVSCNVEELKANIKYLEDKLTEKEERIDALETQIKDLKKVNSDLVQVADLKKPTTEPEAVPKILNKKKKIIKKRG